MEKNETTTGCITSLQDYKETEEDVFHKLIGVSPMMPPTGLVFALRAKERNEKCICGLESGHRIGCYSLSESNKDE